MLWLWMMIVTVTQLQGRGLDAKSMLASLASNFVSRGFVSTGSGSSQVISLNLTNLLVLVLLKALIFAAGSLGAGTWKGGYARSMDGEEKFLTDEEILMFLSYLTGSPGCLQNISCQQPQQAKKYTAAGEMLLKLAKMFSIDADMNYEYIILEMDQAANVGLAGGTCERFECSSNKL
ncbi:hypothetical protein NQ318_006374 [Aromia moschata]|uniref:Uncharacterized protein n=1 Tax=Aromia moschata TaxID=1265417 RepID=A0AAV8YK04_9CUCU|nr:hypothetical protein NQ318_006374 [Aromia moschata]